MYFLSFPFFFLLYIIFLVAYCLLSGAVPSTMTVCFSISPANSRGFSLDVALALRSSTAPHLQLYLFIIFFLSLTESFFFFDVVVYSSFLFIFLLFLFPSVCFFFFCFLQNSSARFSRFFFFYPIRIFLSLSHSFVFLFISFFIFVVAVIYIFSYDPPTNSRFILNFYPLYSSYTPMSSTASSATNASQSERGGAAYCAPFPLPTKRVITKQNTSCTSLDTVAIFSKRSLAPSVFLFLYVYMANSAF